MPQNPINKFKKILSSKISKNSFNIARFLLKNFMFIHVNKASVNFSTFLTGYPRGMSFKKVSQYFLNQKFSLSANHQFFKGFKKIISCFFDGEGLKSSLKCPNHPSKNFTGSFITQVNNKKNNVSIYF